MALGDEIREQRKSLGLGQLETAELAGVSERFVRSAEQGKASLRLDKLEALLDALGLELRALPRGGGGN